MCTFVFEHHVYSTDMRFGFGYECYFDEEGIAYLIMMVTVQDPLHILTDYSGNYEEIKVKLNEKYDVLKEQFGLVNFRMTDSKM